MRGLWAAPFVLLGALLLGAPARAQAVQETPSQIQAQIANGQSAQAIQVLDQVLQAAPKSAVAWYLLAEADDAQHDEIDAGSALNMAERTSPGLPFADPQKVAALRAHIDAVQPQSAVGGHTALLVAGGIVLLLVLLSRLPGRDRAMRNYGYTAPPPPPGTPPYGFGYGPPSAGGGLGSALLGGLAAGAGFAAGERIIDGMMGPQNNDTSRDDGLMGNPGWDNSGPPSDDDLSNTGWS